LGSHFLRFFAHIFDWRVLLNRKYWLNFRPRLNLSDPDDLLVKLFGYSVFDPIMLCDDPLVMMFVKAALKRTAISRLASQRTSDAGDEIEKSIAEMFFNQMLVQVERSRTHDSDVVAHEAFHFLVNRVSTESVRRIYRI
jgi:hypothetical protein